MNASSRRYCQCLHSVDDNSFLLLPKRLFWSFQIVLVAAVFSHAADAGVVGVGFVVVVLGFEHESSRGLFCRFPREHNRPIDDQRGMLSGDHPRTNAMVKILNAPSVSFCRDDSQTD